LYDFEQVRFEEYLEVQPYQPEYNIEHHKLINFGNFIGDIQESEPFVAVSVACENVKQNQDFHVSQIVVRVTLVNYIGEIVLDTLIKPPRNLLLNSKSREHGLTPAIYLQGRAFGDVHKFITKILKNKILIGFNAKYIVDILNLKNQAYIDIGFQSKEAIKPTPLKIQSIEELNANLNYFPSCTIVDARVSMALFKKKRPMYMQFVEGVTAEQVEKLRAQKPQPVP